MATDKRSADTTNTNIGIDGTFWLNNTTNVQGFVARSMTEGGQSGTAYRIAIDKTKRLWGLNLQHLMISDSVQTDMGFTLRTDVRRTDVFARISPRPDVLGLRVVTFFLGGQHYVNTGGDLRDWNFGPFVSFDWESGESLSFFYSPGETVLEEAFTLADRVEIDSMRYDLAFTGGFFSTSPSRAIVLSLDGTHQKIYGGEIINLGANLGTAIGSHLNLEFGYSHNRVDIPKPGGKFNADVGRLKLSYAFSTKLFANLLVQYNSLDNAFSSNLRLNFIHRPGSDLFLVLNDNRGTEQSIWDRQLRDVILKMTYLHRL